MRLLSQSKELLDVGGARIRSEVPLHVFSRSVAIVLGYISWILLATLFPNNLMPYPYQALEATWSLIAQGVAFPHLAATLWRTFLGFGGSLLVGTVIGVLMGVYGFGRKFLSPYVMVGITIPAIAWAAVTTLIFGFSIEAPVVATILTTFPYVAINVWKGVENIDTDLIVMCRSFGVSNRRILRRVILPDTAPALFTASRFGLAISYKIVTIAEMFASNSGVGYKIIQAYTVFQFQNVWAWAILFMGVILIIEYGIFKPLEKRVFAYRQEAEYTIV